MKLPCHKVIFILITVSESVAAVSATATSEELIFLFKKCWIRVIIGQTKRIIFLTISQLLAVGLREFWMFLSSFHLRIIMHGLIFYTLHRYKGGYLLSDKGEYTPSQSFSPIPPLTHRTHHWQDSHKLCHHLYCQGVEELHNLWLHRKHPQVGVITCHWVLGVVEYQHMEMITGGGSRSRNIQEVAVTRGEWRLKWGYE